MSIKRETALGSVLRGTANAINALDKVSSWDGKQMGKVFIFSGGLGALILGGIFIYRKWLLPINEKSKTTIDERTNEELSKKELILKLANSSITQKEIANKVNCSEAYVSRIKKSKEEYQKKK